MARFTLRFGAGKLWGTEVALYAKDTELLCMQSLPNSKAEK